MPGKIDRQPVSPRPKLERAAPAEPAAKVATPSGARPAVSTEFSAQVATGPAPAGSHVALSAQPDALWGGGGGRSSDDPAAIAALNPAERAAKLAEIQGRRDEMQAKIVSRVTELEKKWEAATPETKEAALHEYLDASRYLDPATRRELRGKLRNAEDAHQRIDDLLERREGLPPSRHCNAEEKAKRNALAKELKAARKEEKTEVKAATQVVDAAGLKTDLLAVTEQKIDPNAPKAGSPNSLMGMVTSFFSLNWLAGWVTVLVKTISDISDKKSRDREQAVIKEIQNQQVDQRLAANREAMKMLTVAIRKAQ